MTLRSDATGPVDLRTSNGRIKLAVGSAFRGEMGISTSNGGVRFHNQANIDVNSEIKRRHGTIRFAESGAESKVRSSNGSVTVTAR